MKKILIATKNRDKFTIVKEILDNLNKGEYEYYSLHDVNGISKEDNEYGSIQDRAYNKAKMVFDSVQNETYEYVVGVDDGIEMKGILRENVKDYISDILADRYLLNGEKVNIVRAYCFIKNDGEIKETVTNIPFVYHKSNKHVCIEENSYPLGNVLCPLDSDVSVSNMSNSDCNEYYIKYSCEPLTKVLKEEVRC